MFSVHTHRRSQRALVIDDATTPTGVVSVSRHRARFELDVAEDAREALRLIMRNPYDVIVCPADLGKMTGVDLLAYCAKRQPTSYRVLVNDGERTRGMRLAQGAGKIHRIVQNAFSRGALVECLRAAAIARQSPHQSPTPLAHAA